MNEAATPPMIRHAARDRRQHGRWEVEGAYAEIDGERWPLVDISIGGFRARRPTGASMLSKAFEGTIAWSDGRARGSLDFRARPVRFEQDDDDGEEAMAAAFEPLDGPEIDRLLSLLSGIEAQRRRAMSGDAGGGRSKARRYMMLTLLLLLFAAGVLIGAWAAGFYGLLPTV